MARNGTLALETLERLAPGTPLRQGLERIIQQGKGAIIVLGDGAAVAELSSGGFRLAQPVNFTPPKLSELAKMDGGIILDSEGDFILAANVHFVPSIDIPTDETGSRHRTAQRIAIQAAVPVVAVSEGRRTASVYVDDSKVELRSPTMVAAKVNQDLQTLDRLRRRLDEAENGLTSLEVSELATHRAVVTLLQRAELVRRVGLGIERQAISLGDEGRLAYIQLADMVRGVEFLRDVTLRDYLPTRRKASLVKAREALSALEENDLDDPIRIARAIGFDDLDAPVTPRGYRLLSKVARLPESVREELIKHFKRLPRMLTASVADFEKVEGIGTARATHLQHYFERVRSLAQEWTPQVL
ncbi:MAG TPA: DNA integrity scanning diadenylate cyclase DisA [Acidimicrobiia bacterium]|nr:DNA integrity scanning diadenylate cyclase DisA [Acidimicrobiia bacterium]